ncbi:hypothetical protein [Methylobacterium nigriterrae]|uniref:hypothetical protein n=1 Tax=Methylobacterium nigriterrae TaxID=3127512 RepID=UPI0030136435
MSEKELSLFKSFLANARSYFEFGVGGSTKLAAEVVRGPVIAVDSDKAWIEAVSEQMPQSIYARQLLHVDIGPTREWGHPVSNEYRERFPSYPQAIIAPETKAFDLCLVDGRFRVACFLQALLHLKDDAVIGIHDYRSRPQLHVVEQFARPIAEAEDLTFFTRRFDADLWGIARAISVYSYLAD